MTTDITELAQSLKAAAESVIKNYDCEWFETGRQICTVHKSKVNLISLANPANILALVEALEKAQQLATQQGNIACALFDEVTAQRQRIAELESRTVTVKLPRNYSMLMRNGFDEDYQSQMAFKCKDIIDAITSAGIKWEAE